MYVIKSHLLTAACARYGIVVVVKFKWVCDQWKCQTTCTFKRLTVSVACASPYYPCPSSTLLFVVAVVVTDDWVN